MYMNTKLKRMYMPQSELTNQLNSFKSRLWQYIEVTPSYHQKETYVQWLESNIEEIKLALFNLKQIEIKNQKVG